MIGLAVDTADLAVAAEFFELFKTPWERADPAVRYRVALVMGRGAEGVDADVHLVFGPEGAGTPGSSHRAGPVMVDAASGRFRVYGSLSTFAAGDGSDVLTCDGQPVACRTRVRDATRWRIGYDLLFEVRCLLTGGQPPEDAETPTLEHHIALLRRLLLLSGVAFVEIPPRPQGRPFICCLTHDVDFFGIRRHKADRTAAGFLFRASLGSAFDLLRGRRTLRDAARNWLAAFSLPFVHLGLARDFWQPLADYLAADHGHPATFFLVPFKGRPGASPDGSVQPSRAVAYGVRDLAPALRQLPAHVELAVHGIDAWCDAALGRRELQELTAVTGQPTAGVRMHWLYFDASSPQRLEAAGFAYDSTNGYNDAIGYRAGTSQVFRLAGASDLLELPLSIMDTALLYPRRLSLTHVEALRRCRTIVANARAFGGTVVINWHDRSLSPERQWGRPYRQLLEDVGSGDGAWFATAMQAVQWFRWRRSCAFTVLAGRESVTVTGGQRPADVPGAVVRVHRPGDPVARVEELPLDGDAPVEVRL